MRPIEQIILHCTGTPNGVWRGMREIDAAHRGRGILRTAAAMERMNPELAAVGYHHVIYTNGAIATGRHHEEMGGHAAGANAFSIGVALVGTNQFTPEQWRSLRELIERLVERFPGAAIVGHGELPASRGPCPGFSVAAWLAGGRNALAEHLCRAQEAKAACAPRCAFVAA